VALSLGAVPLDGALRLKMGSNKQECMAVLGQNENLTEDSINADEIRYGGIFDRYYNSVVKLHFRNGKLALIRIELLQVDPREVFNEITDKITNKYQIAAVIDTDNATALWSFDNSRYIKLYQNNMLLMLDYADGALLNEAEDTSQYY
jgi:hypothetical protein